MNPTPAHPPSETPARDLSGAGALPAAGGLVLFDGTCALCHGWVRFVLHRDPAGRFRFAPLQSPSVAPLLRRHRLPEGFLGSVLLVENAGTGSERLHVRSEAALRILTGLGGAWRCAGVFRLVPTRLRDAVYDFIAARRHRWFGRADACELPRPEWRDRFLG